MAIFGTLALENYRIQFSIDCNDTASWTITDLYTGEQESIRGENYEASKFMKALSIAVHYDGMPNGEVDYPDAESIMKSIRWIP